MLMLLVYLLYAYLFELMTANFNTGTGLWNNMFFLRSLVPKKK